MKLEEIIEGIKPVEQKWIQKAQERTAQLVMPTRALGRLHEISERLCGIQQTLEPSINQKAILVMAGDHGVVEEGVSAYPQEVTPAMVQTFLAGGAGINAISRQVGADVWVVDMGIIPELDSSGLKGAERLLVEKIGNGTANFTKRTRHVAPGCGKSVAGRVRTGLKTRSKMGRIFSVPATWESATPRLRPPSVRLLPGPPWMRWLGAGPELMMPDWRANATSFDAVLKPIHRSPKMAWTFWRKSADLKSAGSPARYLPALFTGGRWLWTDLSQRRAP